MDRVQIIMIVEALILSVIATLLLLKPSNVTLSYAISIILAEDGLKYLGLKYTLSFYVYFASV